jgi:hypothetical protein
LILFGILEDLEDSDASLINFSICIIFSIIGLYYALKLIKKDQPITTIAYNKVLDLSLNGKIEFKPYRDLIFGLTIKRKVIIFVF